MKKITGLLVLMVAMAISGFAQTSSQSKIVIYAEIPADEPVDVVVYGKAFDGSLLACPLAQSPSGNNAFSGYCYNTTPARPVVFFTVTSRANPETVLFYDAASIPYIIAYIDSKGKRFRIVF